MTQSSPEHRSRSTFHHGDLPAALMRAAVELIGRHGVEGFSLRGAAAAIGVSPSAAYKHFADKGVLLNAVARAGFAELASTTERQMMLARKQSGNSRAGATAVLQANALAYVAFAVAQPAKFRLMFGPYGAGSDHAVRGAADSGKDPYQLLSEALDELQKAGLLSSPARQGAELTAWSAVHGLADILIGGLITEADGISPEAATLRIVHTLVQGWAGIENNALT
jgi:AcrR family transcriptional regulator